MSQNIMVTGASGHLGSRIVELLIDSYKGKIIAGSRTLDKIKYIESKGVELRLVDFDQPELLDTSFNGVDRLLLISTDSIAVPGLRLKQHVNAIAAAKRAGVKHIIYTSLTNAETSPISFAPDHFGSEMAIKDSGIPYTILRNNWYIENALSSLAQAVASGKLVHSTSHGKVGFIAREDCAQVAAAIINSDKFKNVTLDVTGEESLSYTDLAGYTAEISGNPVTLVNVTEEDMRKALTSYQLPPFVVDLVATFEKAVSRGDQDVRNSLVFELTGKHPQRVKDFLKDHKQDLGL